MYSYNESALTTAVQHLKVGISRNELWFLQG